MRIRSFEEALYALYTIEFSVAIYGQGLRELGNWFHRVSNELESRPNPGHANQASHFTIRMMRQIKNMKMEILLIPCIIFRLKLLGSSGFGLRNVMYPIIFFQTSMLDQLLGRSYVFLFRDSSLSPSLLTTIHRPLVNLSRSPR